MHDDRASHRRSERAGGQHTFSNNDPDFAGVEEARNAAHVEAQAVDSPTHDDNDAEATISGAVPHKVEEECQVPGVETTPATSAIDEASPQVSDDAPPTCSTSDQRTAVDTQAKHETETEPAVPQAETVP